MNTDDTLARLLIDNAATAAQNDFDEVTREAIKLNVFDPLVGVLSAAKAAVAYYDRLDRDHDEGAAVQDLVWRGTTRCTRDWRRKSRSCAR